jgi:hypothetical protein
MLPPRRAIVEKNFLRRRRAFDFSHSLGQKRKWLLLHSINSSVGQEVSEDVESTGIVDTITQTVPEGSPVGTVVAEEGYPPHLATSIFMIAAGGFAFYCLSPSICRWNCPRIRL